ncbi:hypothetical protein [Caenimonas sp. SL110]|uniref:hypothetical protein n=1 Tax=Caenimonas sp. SL110 TaxID=1450524 RepID=UPI0006547778|nr:hypothetical protein [Caenimonas sp. SL110]
MTLKNLLGISLDEIKPDAAQIGKLLAAAARNIADAQITGLSPENRFDAAYKAIMQLAMISLNANGYRTLTSKPGHHQTAIQTLNLTVGVPMKQVIFLDALRKQRNVSDYSGDLVSDAAVTECLASAQELLVQVRAWLKANRGDLLESGVALTGGVGSQRGNK